MDEQTSDTAVTIIGAMLTPALFILATASLSLVATPSRAMRARDPGRNVVHHNGARQ